MQSGALNSTKRSNVINGAKKSEQFAVLKVYHIFSRKLEGKKKKKKPMSVDCFKIFAYN